MIGCFRLQMDGVMTGKRAIYSSMNGRDGGRIK